MGDMHPQASTLPPPERGTPSHDLALQSARRAEAVRRKLAGETYAAIAEDMGYSDPSAVRQLVKRALQRVETRAVDEYRDVQHARLEAQHAELWHLVTAPRHPDAAGYVDPDTRIKAVLAALRNEERTARLLGLDHADGIAERSVELEADRVRLVALAFGSALDALNLSDEDREKATEVLLSELRSRDGEAG